MEAKKTETVSSPRAAHEVPCVMDLSQNSFKGPKFRSEGVLTAELASRRLPQAQAAAGITPAPGQRMIFRGPAAKIFFVVLIP